jgi:hypothetical protein
MHDSTEMVEIVLLAVFVASISTACNTKQWIKEGSDQRIQKQDLTDCRSLAEMKAREEFPEFLTFSSMEFEPNYISIKDANLEKYRWARIQHEKECMEEKGYHIE